ncbi:hypothetical protein DN069_12205, partial [Streptacidiphilus pinicola]
MSEPVLHRRERAGVGPAVFRLRGPATSVEPVGPLTRFTDLAAAESAVRGAGHSAVVTGAIPFDSEHAKPSLYLGTRGTARPSSATAGGARPGRFLPDVGFNDAEVAGYIEQLDRVLPILRSPHHALEKIVVARAERFTYTGVLDARQVYEQIATAYPQVHSYFVEHATTPGLYTMGASPELFLKKTGERISLTPLAGTFPRDPHLPAGQDRARAQAALLTPKYLDEHRHLVDFMVKHLAPFCSELLHPDQPQLVGAPGVWHLGTPIHGRLADHRYRTADLVTALHPSPAVCGVPQEQARGLIADHESPRGYYGGLVGWLDGRGDCEFYMALRGFELDARQRHLTLRAGGGIVADSRPQTEYTETAAKLSTMRQVLGIEPPAGAPAPRPRQLAH